MNSFTLGHFPRCCVYNSIVDIIKYLLGNVELNKKMDEVFPASIVTEGDIQSLFITQASVKDSIEHTQARIGSQ